MVWGSRVRGMMPVVHSGLDMGFGVGRWACVVWFVVIVIDLCSAMIVASIDRHQSGRVYRGEAPTAGGVLKGVEFILDSGNECSVGAKLVGRGVMFRTP